MSDASETNVGAAGAESPSVADDRLRAVDQQLADLRATLTEQSRNLQFISERAAQQAAPPPAPRRKFTEEDLQTAFAEGNLSSLIDEKFESVIADRLQRFEQEKFAPLEQVGLGAIERLNLESLQNRTPWAKDEKIRKSAEAMLKQVDPRLRANPETVERIYKLAAGENMDSIIEAKRQEWEREMRDSGALRPSGSGNVRQENEGARANLRDLVAKGFVSGAAARIIENKGGLEGFAKKLGYASGEDYAEVEWGWSPEEPN